MTAPPPLLEPRADAEGPATAPVVPEGDLLTWPERERLALRLFDAALVELVRRLTDDPEAAKGTTFGEVSKLLATYHKEVEPKRPLDPGYLDDLDLPFPSTGEGDLTADHDHHDDEDDTSGATALPDLSDLDLPFPGNDDDNTNPNRRA